MGPQLGCDAVSWRGEINANGVRGSAINHSRKAGPRRGVTAYVLARKYSEWRYNEEGGAKPPKNRMVLTRGPS